MAMHATRAEASATPQGCVRTKGKVRAVTRRQEVTRRGKEEERQEADLTQQVNHFTQKVSAKQEENLVTRRPTRKEEAKGIKARAGPVAWWGTNLLSAEEDPGALT